MRINHFAGAGQAESIDDAGVIGAIGKNDIAGANEGAQQTHIRRIARIEIKGRF